MNSRLNTVTRGLASLLLPGAAALASGIPINNGGFEGASLTMCQFSMTIPGWTIGAAGSWKPGSGTQCLHSFTSGPTEGAQVGYINSGTISQVLASNLQAGLPYRLAVDVGRRLDCCVMQDYRVQLLAGGTVLGEDHDGVDPAPGTFATSIIDFTAPADHPALGQPLEIRIQLLAGGQGQFDFVRLCTSPVPADLNLDCGVNGVDLAKLLSAWGRCPVDSPCPADLNHDNIVNGLDLAAMLATWG